MNKILSSALIMILVASYAMMVIAVPTNVLALVQNPVGYSATEIVC